MSPAEITCLFTHKCSDRAHEVGMLLKTRLLESGIELLIDPFRLGDDIETRIDSFQFDALLFLSSPDSLGSPPCQHELRTARRRSVPVFGVLLAGEMPAEMKKRVYWPPSSTQSPQFEGEVAELGHAIRARVAFLRDLRTLNSDRAPDETLESAQRIALNADRTLVAELSSVLARKYVQLKDPSTRFWIALALGNAGTPKAAKLLNDLPKDDHPYALEGIRQALETVRK
jgi:hypothetical protein